MRKRCDFLMQMCRQVLLGAEAYVTPIQSYRRTAMQSVRLSISDVFLVTTFLNTLPCISVLSGMLDSLTKWERQCMSESATCAPHASPTLLGSVQSGVNDKRANERVAAQSRSPFLVHLQLSANSSSMHAEFWVGVQLDTISIVTNRSKLTR